MSVNPARDVFSLDIDQGYDPDLELVMTDLNGRIIRKWNTRQEIEYPIADLPAGAYLLGLTDGQRSSWKRIIIE